jgi:hypothetical protein
MVTAAPRPQHVLLIVVGLIAAFIAGFSAAGLLAKDHCLDAGGRVGTRGVCEGVSPGS